MNKFKKGDKVKFTEEAQKNISKASGDINRIKEVVFYEDESQPYYKLYNQLNEHVCYTEDCFVSANSFDEKTKIKDLIPEGYEFDDIIYTVDSAVRNYTFKSIRFKKKEKTFENYVEKYKKDKWIPPDLEEWEEWKIEERLGLLWYIIKDKGGNLMSLVNLLDMIYHNREEMSYTGTETSLDVWNLLPFSFIESIRNE